MTVRLVNSRWMICDGTAWTTQWVGLSSGDFFEEERALGHYIAAWYPNTLEPAQILVTLVNERLQPTLSLALTCPPGKPELLVHVEAEEVPWGDDGDVSFGPIVSPSEFATFTSAGLARSLGELVVREDAALFKYVIDPTRNISDEPSWADDADA